MAVDKLKLGPKGPQRDTVSRVVTLFGSLALTRATVTVSSHAKLPAVTLKEPPGEMVSEEVGVNSINGPAGWATAGSGASTLGTKSASPTSARSTSFAVRWPVIKPPLIPLRQKVAPSYMCLARRQSGASGLSLR